MNLIQTILRSARRIAKAVYLRVLFHSGLLRWARLQAARRGIVVLTLHRVLPDDQYVQLHPQPGMALRASTFERLLEYGSRYCRWIPPEKANTAFDQPDTRPAMALTFDDGWRDNFTTAFPIARKYAAPFTVFLCPQMIDRAASFWTETVNTLWWKAQHEGKLDRVRLLCNNGEGDSAGSLIQNLKRVAPDQREQFVEKMQTSLGSANGTAAANRLLAWAEVKEMAAAGVGFGSHTNTHQILTEVGADEARVELQESKAAIAEKLSSCSAFAYPNGNWSQPVRDLVAESGYATAFVNAPGIWKKSSDRFSIPRVNVWEGSFTSANGQFSRLALEYAIFWKAGRGSR